MICVLYDNMAVICVYCAGCRDFWYYSDDNCTVKVHKDYYTMMNRVDSLFDLHIFLDIHITILSDLYLIINKCVFETPSRSTDRSLISSALYAAFENIAW